MTTRCVSYAQLLIGRIVLTIVDELKLRDDVQADIREFVLEHLKEHGEEVFGGSSTRSAFEPKQSYGVSYSCLPKIGARPLIWLPKEARTCCEESETSSSTAGMISWSRVSLSTSAQKPGIWPAIAVRTSASVSFRNLMKAGTRSRLTTSSSTALAI